MTSLYKRHYHVLTKVEMDVWRFVIDNVPMLTITKVDDNVTPSTNLSDIVKRAMYGYDSR